MASILLALLACRSPVVPTDITVVANPDIVTVLHVSWVTAEPTIGRVHFGESPTYGSTTPWETTATTQHEAVLLGLHGDTEVHLQVELQGDEKSEAVLSDDHSFVTAAIPSDIPSFEVIDPVTNPNIGPWILTSTQTVDGTSALVVIDPEGAPVWYWRPNGGVESVRPTPDGRGVITVAGNVTDYSNNFVLEVSWDGVAVETPLPHAHHDLIVQPDGSWVTLVADYREVDGETVAGDQLVEITPDGTQRVIWNAFDHLPVVVNSGWALSRLPDIADWTHANGLTADAAGDLYVSLYFPEQVVKVEADTGATAWVLGGEGGDFVVDVPFGPQHAPEVVGDSIRLFDNGSTDSRVVEYTLDVTAGTATQSWQWTPASSPWTPLLGDVIRFEDGSAVASWGASGDIYGVDSAGNEAGHLHVSVPAPVGQITVLDGFYPAE